MFIGLYSLDCVHWIVFIEFSVFVSFWSVDSFLFLIDSFHAGILSNISVLSLVPSLTTIAKPIKASLMVHMMTRNLPSYYPDSLTRSCCVPIVNFPKSSGKSTKRKEPSRSTVRRVEITQQCRWHTS